MAKRGSIEIGLILDTETTGLRGHDEIIEYGHVLFRYDKRDGEVLEIMDEYCAFREPTVPIGKTAQRITGITLEMVQGHSLDQKHITDCMQAAQKIYAHNMGFDRRFISALYPDLQNLHWVCTMNGVDWLAQGVRSKKLDDIVAFYGIADDAEHRALDDAKAVLAAVQREDIHTGARHLVKLARRRQRQLTQYSAKHSSQHAQPKPDDTAVSPVRRWFGGFP